MARQKAKKESPPLPLENKEKWAITGFRMQSVLLILIGFIFYASSFSNEYALDDGIVILKNDYVQRGLRGIPKILSTDAYDSFYRQMGARQQLSGGRYRPLSVVTFAIEQQFFGGSEKVKPPDDAAFIRHFMNVVYYILSVVFLLYFLRNFIFREKEWIAFAVSLLFLIHPMHTEVVANVKSRDEILSFLFIILTFIYAFRYREERTTKNIALALLFYFLALLSKEYGITLLILIPMLFYIVRKETFGSAFFAMLPYAAVAAIYMIIRFKIVGKGSTEENPDVLNNPYMFALPAEKLATKLEVLNRYLKLLFFPNTLSSDYSFSTIPYTNFHNSNVWASIVIHVTMAASAVYFFFKRNIISFALAFYLLHLLLISNLVFNVGATMGERMVYHSSLGFLIILVVAGERILQLFSAQRVKQIVAVSLGSLIVIWCGAKTIPRNVEWKNDATLFIADAAKVPQSALVNGNAGKAYVDMSDKPENKTRRDELLGKAIYHLTRSVRVHNRYVNGYLNRGVAYFNLKDYDDAEKDWNTVKKIYPNNPFLKRNFGLLASVYFNKGMNIGPKNPKEAIRWMEKAVQARADTAFYWYNLGGASYMVGDYPRARTAWVQTLALKNDDSATTRGMKALMPKLDSIVLATPQNADTWYDLGEAAYMIRNYPKARDAWAHALQLKPDHEKAKQGMSVLPAQQ
ncbi:MAG: tetratricopeptide repeat protein [Bacteroidia bacterium]